MSEESRVPVVKENFFEIQLLLNIFEITAIIILAFLYLKLATSRKNNLLVEKIEYLCKNLKVLIEDSEKYSDTIKKNIEEFKRMYGKNVAEIEKKTLELNEIIGKLERNENISGKMQEHNKYERIKLLLNEGHSAEAIAKMLKISKGEVELVLSLIKTAGSA